MYAAADVNEMLMVVAFLWRRGVGKRSGSSPAVTTSARVSEFSSARNVYTSRSSPHEVR